ncbi:hypothetical protein [Streptomyces sp. CBMA29]|uniref:hypothetical protein n=1 Tax=Streptomyces sp. CBMA29 TaxID=1896314 RepID=UPI001661EC04|nr:hypothetical protein [Streptomyces sp. CBMA29]MBD0734537.1 hypothetical protein [Streptomyces sp. CBMA29]
MKRSVLFKRGAAGIVAALALTAGVPGLVASAAAAAVAVPHPVTLDFSKDMPSGSTADSAFGEHGAVRDADGASVGGAVIGCNDISGVKGDVILCTGIIDLYNRGEISFTVGNLVKPDHTSARTVDGVITGGTEEFEGISGQIHITATSDGVYKAEFESKA